MRFNWIELKNFRSYGNETTHLDFNFTGVKLLIGENGSGKTTFLQALLWCIYGASPGNVDDLINRDTKKDCKVEVNFEKNGNDYSIIRFRKHSENGNSLLLFKNNENISGKTNTITQEIILDLVGMNYKAMTSSIVYSSEIYSSFLRARLSDRLKIYEEVLSANDIKKYYEILKKKRQESFNKFNEQKKVDEILIAKINSTEETLGDYKNKSKTALINLKKEKDEKLREIETLEKKLENDKIVDVDNELKKYEEYEEANKKQKETEKLIETQKNKLIDVDALNRKIKLHYENLERYEQINIEKEKELIEEYEKIVKSNETKKHNVEILKNKIIDTAANRELLAINSKKKIEIEEKINKINSNLSVCPTCGQPVKKGFNEKLIEDYRKQLEKIDEDINKNKSIIGKAEKNNTLLLEEINEIVLDKEIAPEYTENFLNVVKDKKTENKNAINMLEAEIANATKFNKEILHQINELKKEAVNLNYAFEFTKPYLLNLKSEIQNSEERIDILKNEINVLNGKAKVVYDKEYVSSMENKIKDINEQRKKLAKKIKKLENELKHFDFMVNLFSNKSFGIKKFIIEKTLIAFNEQINFYLPFFFENDVNITFDNNLEEKILINKAIVPFDGFSSGEKSRLELAIAFGLFTMVKAFFSSSINILIFDELLDVMNLDKPGIMAVINIINSLAEDNAILVITHRDEYKDFFQNHLYIIKENGFSRIISD